MDDEQRKAFNLWWEEYHGTPLTKFRLETEAGDEETAFVAGWGAGVASLMGRVESRLAQMGSMPERRVAAAQPTADVALRNIGDILKKKKKGGEHGQINKDQPRRKGTALPVRRQNPKGRKAGV